MSFAFPPLLASPQKHMPSTVEVLGGHRNVSANGLWLHSSSSVAVRLNGSLAHRAVGMFTSSNAFILSGLRLSYSTVCRAEQDDLQMKRERDMKLIEQSLPDVAELDKDALSTILDLEFESSSGFETARHYEIMFLVHEVNESEVQDVVKKVKDFIKENKGRIWRVNDWGMRRLAYKIKKASRAHYILMNIEIGRQKIDQLNSLLLKDERVIRHMTITRKKAITQDSEPPPEYNAYESANEQDGESEEELDAVEDSEEELDAEEDSEEELDVEEDSEEELEDIEEPEVSLNR